mmetsp:Transcript_13953/g.35500  ORF Transcript_13953/g.35500 Transcript_13953/m.35500 type:complete len:87 (+) Transcript_13953:271-531(+)
MACLVSPPRHQRALARPHPWARACALAAWVHTQYHPFPIAFAPPTGALAASRGPVSMLRIADMFRHGAPSTALELLRPPTRARRGR